MVVVTTPMPRDEVAIFVTRDRRRKFNPGWAKVFEG